MSSRLPVIFWFVPIIALCAGLTVYFQFFHAAAVDARTVNGESITWVDARGKWVYINFFAEWCAPCLKEIPEINQFAAQAGQDTEVYMVSYDLLAIEKLQSIIDKYGIRVPVIVNNESLSLPVPIPSALPATYLLSPDGVLIEQRLGEVNKNVLAAMRPH